MSKIDLSFDFLEPLFAAVERLDNTRQIAICSVTFVLLIGLFVWFSFLPKMSRIGELKNELKTTRARLVTAQRNASQLTMFRKKMSEAEVEFEAARKALPEKQEIPSLLTGISRSGQDAGLDFLLFQPQNEKLAEFYAEIPVSIKVSGRYHSVAVFFDKVAKLNRIVNIRNIKMTAQRQRESLETSCTAVTYKFIEPKPAKAK